MGPIHHPEFLTFPFDNFLLLLFLFLMIPSILLPHEKAQSKAHFWAYCYAGL